MTTPSCATRSCRQPWASATRQCAFVRWTGSCRGYAQRPCRPCGRRCWILLPPTVRGRSKRCDLGCWPSMAQRGSFRPIRTSRPGGWPCHSSTTRATGRSTTCSAWTWKARPSSKPRLAPLAAPRPADGVSDLRGSDRRRADALLELTRRAVSCPDGIPQVAKAQLFLTVHIDDVKNEVKAGTTVGGADAGTVLAADGTPDRLRCRTAADSDERPGAGPRPRHHDPLLHAGADQGPVAEGSCLHDPRLRNAGAVV